MGLFQDHSICRNPDAVPLCAGTGLWLQKRARHVYHEAARVPEFRAICHSPTLDPAAKLQCLGMLMDASQVSCRRAPCPLCASRSLGAGLRKGLWTPGPRGRAAVPALTDAAGPPAGAHLSRLLVYFFINTELTRATCSAAWTAKLS